MLVKKWMSKGIVSVNPEDSMQQAVKLMREHRVQLLPVMKGKKLVGVVSASDLKRASVSRAITLDIQDLLYQVHETKIKDIMTADTITIPLYETVDEAAQVLLKNNISGAPVVDPKGTVVGVITRDDIFRVLISLTAMGARGIQFAFHVKDIPGALKALIDTIRSHGGRTVSVLSSFENAPPGYRNVYIRAFNLDRAKLPHIILELKEKAIMLYMVDHRENTREICE
jgi:acetoin utilization protein AcuB